MWPTRLRIEAETQAGYQVAPATAVPGMRLSALWLVQVPEQYRAVLAHGMLGARPLPRALQIPMPLPPPPQLVAAATTTSPAGNVRFSRSCSANCLLQGSRVNPSTLTGY